MAEKIKTNVTERNVGEYKVPDEVYNANWRDDVELEAKEQDNIKQKFEFFENESTYDSARNVMTDPDRIAKFRVAKQIRRITLKSLR